MNRIRIILILAAAAIMASCTKELDIDYRQVEPIYILQADITDSPAKAQLTQSRDMSDPNKPAGIGTAQIVLRDDQGRSEELVFGSDGYYRSPSGWVGETGRTYTLTATIDGKQYAATSTMRPAATLDSIGYIWLSTSGMKMLIMQCYHTYPEGVNQNYTYVTATKNGDFFRNQAAKQFNPQERNAIALLGCTTEKVMDEDEPDKQDVILHDGDKVHVELWTIDLPVYDYFSSLRSSQQNASQPLTNFTEVPANAITASATSASSSAAGAAVPAQLTGYFSAHHTSAIDLTFYRSQIKE